ncbi:MULTISPECIES: MucR family transcriptional regulator [unclassified Methylobacterium]|uniref:MucR family transcriptional regulator n=1 Tax=unclassified Methylobacterium TaxID=2615210 RepID=UPI0011C2077B|nr:MULTISPECIES: MucR family transcriptional regulator [unclassified Methylobacterium]QEE41949.1 MucR family transcriptional regulator [Methylobacterium sp. WL1]TXM99511.1 MucR family transcriptional regulator [Methylobacterium sp. WL64]TXN54556.1 MucR family transcriptional regulator [Methylobacterium sp. WL2]
MINEPEARSSFLLEKVGAIVAAYVSRNPVGAGDLPVLIDQVHAAISVLQRNPAGSARSWTGPAAAEVEASIGENGLISFIDGRSYKTLKRHLTANGLTPERYRAKFGLPANYPMVAPGYAKRRSEIARAIQLGNQAA